MHRQVLRNGNYAVGDVVKFNFHHEIPTSEEPGMTVHGTIVAQLDTENIGVDFFVIESFFSGDMTFHVRDTLLLQPVDNEEQEYDRTENSNRDEQRRVQNETGQLADN